MKLPPRTISALLGVATFALTAIRILSFGYLPPDDVLRHSAFATTQRTWDQILLGRPEALFDQSPGWHGFLRLVHHLTKASPEALAIFSIFFCLVLFLAAGLLWVQRWEAWALTLAALFLLDGALIQRLTLGRPFLITESLVVCLLGSIRIPRLDPWRSKRHAGWLLAGMIATWVHGSWYLLFLLPTCLIVARRWREALRLGAALLVGCFLGALLTGHPFRFLWGEVAHLVSALGQSAQVPFLVMEFLPGGKDQSLLVPALVGLMAVWMGKSAGRVPLSRDGVLILGIFAWIMGYFWVWRFYLDWAFPALALWTAWRLDEILDELHSVRFGKTLFSGLTAMFFIFGVAMNSSGRWSTDGRDFGLDPSKVTDRLLLPEPGGVLYSNSMYVFYATFFMNPEGQWHYILGYEPGLMNAEDYQVFQLSFTKLGAPKALEPWVSRMTARDRLVILGVPNAAPGIPQLHWTFAAPNKWVGQKIRGSANGS